MENRASGDGAVGNDSDNSTTTTTTTALAPPTPPEEMATATGAFDAIPAPASTAATTTTAAATVTATATATPTATATATATITTATSANVDVAPPGQEGDVEMSGVTGMQEASASVEDPDCPPPATEPPTTTTTTTTTSETQPLVTASSSQSGIAAVAHDATSPPAAADHQGQPEFATPQKRTSSDLRNIILAAQSQALFRQGSVPPSPVVAPGALHELGDIDAPDRRRSSAVGSIAGLEELRNRLDRAGAVPDQSRFDQLIQATGLNGEENPTPVVDAFLRLDFEDGNVYYIKNPSVVFGRAEEHSTSIYSHVGPDGSTIIETGPRGFGTTTSSGLTSMKREKKKKKDDLLDQTVSTTSDSGTPSSGLGHPPRFRDPFAAPPEAPEAPEEPVIHLPPSNSSIDSSTPLPPVKNISRRHARLFYNPCKRRFELEIIGKNGAFVNEEYVQAGTTIVVEEKGFRVQIGGISFTVIVPEILPGEGSARRDGDEGEKEAGDADPLPKFTGGKGKMSFSFHDENGNEIRTDYSGNEDLSMGDLDDPDSDGEESADSDGADVDDEGESGEDADEEDDNDDSSDDGELEPSSSPEPVQQHRPKPRKSIADIKRRERELQQDRERIKELQRQLREKEKEKAQAEAEEERLRLAREQEKRREGERERARDEKRKKKAAEVQRQKEAKQKEKEMQRIAKEKEREREREMRRQQKLLHPPQSAAKREEQKLILPTISSTKPAPNLVPNPAPNHSQSPAAPPAALLPTQPMDSMPAPRPQSQQSQTLQQQPQPPQQLSQNQYSSGAPPMIDPMLYEPAMMQSMHDSSPVHAHTQNLQPALEKPRKEKALPKQKKLRSPSPEIKEADLPPELLAKPTCSYVVMIHEAIVNSAEKVLSLPQIYKAIETKYPYYKFVVSTNGWQSSVRHNLGQHKAFYKVDRAGKGWLWGVVDGVGIEKEKKGSSSKQNTQAGYDVSGTNGQNGQGIVHTGPMTIAQATPGYNQPPTNPRGISDANGLQHQAPAVHGVAPPIHRQTKAVPQTPPAPPPVYMPPARLQQPAPPQPRPDPPMPRGSGTQQAEKTDVKALVAILTKAIAQRSAQPSPDASTTKGLEQLKGFLAQLASGKPHPGAVEAMTNIVASLKQQGSAAGKAPYSSPLPPPPSAPQAIPQAPVPQSSSIPPQFVPSSSSSSPLYPHLLPPAAPPATPVPLTSTAMAATPTQGQGQVEGKLPAMAPGKTPIVSVSTLQQQIKTMTTEERKAWTKKLLEMKAKNAAAAAAKAAVGSTPQAQSPPPSLLQLSSLGSPQPPTAGKSPIPVLAAPVGNATSAGSVVPLSNPLVAEAPETPRQQIEVAKASQAIKRPLESSDGSGVSASNRHVADGMISGLGEGEPPAKKVDVGAAREAE